MGRLKPTPVNVLLSNLENTGHFRIRAYSQQGQYDSHKTVFDIVVIDENRRFKHEWKYRYELEFDHKGLVAAIDPEQLIADKLYLCICGVLKAIGDNVVGKYPATRLWADLYLSNKRPDMLFNPNKNVEGWLHNKYRGRQPRDEQLVPVSGVSMTTISRSPDELDDDRVDDDLEERLAESVETNKLKKQAEELVMAASSKKVVKKKSVTTFKPPINPKKVKRIPCPVHEEPMEFDPVKQKWKCPRPTCKQTARPVKDEEDRSVQVGKGATSLRVVAVDAGITVLLISDDNVALNVTDLIDVPDFLSQNGIVDAARTAVESGRNEFVDTTERQLVLELKVGVIGAEELIENIDF